MFDPADTAAFVEWETSITPAILEGLAPIQVVASPHGLDPFHGENPLRLVGSQRAA